ncbi:MAG: hypothetical protein COV44_08990 [Deltaproteobacteria bacterium CG11_big_fil_rev_8_21_14_0_20_45_16]|nr:MAG: hypothetical protein COV44_08990 [Deltaproteobacteria bacterium CG11_big_fil_rev_8_21_14_0_20_45_16]
MTLTFLSLLILSQVSDGWQENARMEDEVNFFYTGVSSPSDNERRARDEAINQARSAFLIEHFGLHLRIDERVISNLDQQAVTQDLSIRTPEHYLVGEKIESIKRRKNITYVLLSYPKSEVEKQKRNIKVSPQLSPKTLKSETSRSGSAELIITTEPESALVYLNGVPIGTTPLHARGLQPGAADLELALPLHKAVKREIILADGAPLKVKERIAPEIGRLSLDVEPRSAHVEIKDVFNDAASELASLKLKAGEHRIRVSHPDFESIEQTIFVSPGSDTYRRIELKPKPAKISFISNKYPFKANFIGKEDEAHSIEIENNEPQLIEPMFEKVIARKDGFENVDVDLNLKPNVSTGIQITFIPGESKTIGNSRSRESGSIFRNPWFWGGLVAAGILTGVLVGGVGGGGKSSTSSDTSSPPQNDSGSGGVKINIK